MSCSDKPSAPEPFRNDLGQPGGIDVVRVFGFHDVDPCLEAKVAACLGEVLEALAAESENGILIVHADDDEPESSSIAATEATKADVIRAVKLLNHGKGVADYDIQDAMEIPRIELTWLLAECVEGGFLQGSKPDDHAATVYWIPTSSDARQKADQGPSTTQPSPVDEYQNGGSRRQLDLFDRNPNKET